MPDAEERDGEGVLVFADGVSIEGWMALAAGLVSAIVSGYVLIVQARAKIRSDARQQQVSEHEKLIDRQSKDLELQRQQIHDQQEAIDRMHLAHAQCREESASLYGFLMMFRNGWAVMANEVRNLGGNPPDIPDMPDRRITTLNTSDSEFLRRTMGHNTELMDKLTGQPGSQNTDQSGPTNQGSGTQGTKPYTPLPPTKKS